MAAPAGSVATEAPKSAAGPAAADRRLQPQAALRRRSEKRQRLPAGGRGLRLFGVERQPRPHHAALGHRRRLLPVPGQGQVTVAGAAGDARRAADARRQEPIRRVLRRTGGLLRRTDGQRAGRRGGRHARAADRGRLPGLRGRRAVLSADDQAGHGHAGGRCGRPDRPLQSPALHPRRQPMVSEQDALARRIRDGNLLAVLATFFGFGPAARLHALRVADGPDPLRHHRRPGRDRLTTRAGVLAVAGLRAGHGADLHDRRRGLRGGRPAGAGRLPEALDHLRSSPACSCCSRSRMFGVFNLQLPSALQSGSPTSATSSGRARWSAPR